MRARTPAGLAVGLACLVVAGCSGDPAAEATRSVQASRSAAAARTTDATGAQGARSELTKESCVADKDGSWSFRGTLTNTRDGAAGYVVTASVVDGKSFTVLGRKEITKSLDAGSSADLSAEHFARSTREGAQCVLRVTRKDA